MISFRRRTRGRALSNGPPRSGLGSTFLLIGIAVVALTLVLASWIEFAVAGLPSMQAVPQTSPDNFTGPHGFPIRVRYCYFFNFLFLMMLIRCFWFT